MQCLLGFCKNVKGKWSSFRIHSCGSYGNWLAAHPKSYTAACAIGSAAIAVKYKGIKPILVGCKTSIACAVYSGAGRRGEGVFYIACADASGAYIAGINGCRNIARQSILLVAFQVFGYLWLPVAHPNITPFATITIT